MKENYVRKAELKDALELAPKMRIGDRKEIMASNGSTPLESLVIPFTQKGAKIYSIIGTNSEGVIGMFGSTPTNEKDYGVGAQILRDLGVSKLKLISNNPQKRIGIIGYGLEITDYVALKGQSASDTVS